MESNVSTMRSYYIRSVTGLAQTSSHALSSALDARRQFTAHCRVEKKTGEGIIGRSVERLEKSTRVSPRGLRHHPSSHHPGSTDCDKRGTLYTHKARASQAALLEVLYAEKVSSRYDDHSVIPVFDFTALDEDRIEERSYVHHFFGFDTYWSRKSAGQSSFPQTYLRPRLESLVNAYVAGQHPTRWRLAEGIFPQYGSREAVFLTVLLKPEEDGYRTVDCIARYM